MNDKIISYPDKNLALLILIYDKYSANIFGFILNQGYSEEQGKKILIKVFLKLWENIQWFIVNSENHLLEIIKYTCKILNLKLKDIKSILNK